jgi:hypothetical protein
MAKAALLGDNGDQDGEDPFGFLRREGRSGLGGAVGRLPRLAPRATAGYAVSGLGGPETPVASGGGLPREFGKKADKV